MISEIATAAALAFTVNTTEAQVDICHSAASVENYLNLHDPSDKSQCHGVIKRPFRGIKKKQTSYFIETSQYELYKKIGFLKFNFMNTMTALISY